MSGAEAAKRQILFVDDEQGVLDGFRNVLRGQRRGWDMVFALGGGAALAELDRRQFDVVVSDMRMPGMDGATLLAKVKEKQPRAVRIVLSGQTDLESAMRTVLVAHQFLSKPCDVEILRSTVERACKLNEMLHSEGLRKVAGDVSLLPSSPGVYTAITQALAKNSSTISDIARIVEKDPGLCAKILQVANSAFFGIGRKVTSVTEASTYLGMVTLKNLALMLESFPQIKGASPQQKETFRKLQVHSLLVAFLARQIVGKTDKRRSDEAFVAGMLHDVGHAILAMRGDAVAGESGVDHAVLGAYLLGIWGLPFPVTEAVANHNSPMAIEHTGLEVVDAVYLADRIAGKIREAPFDLVDPEIDMARMQLLGVTVEQIATWEASGREQIDALLAF
jgi:HD-like signal output (HDOD) protein